MLVTAGAVGAPGVLIVPLQKEFGWSTAEISSALAIRFMLFGLMAPFAAALMNRFGMRKVTLSALLIIVSGLLASLAMTQVWQLVLLWGVVVGLGTGMTALVLGATVATRWFSARRGLVVGMLTASSRPASCSSCRCWRADRAFGWRIALALSASCWSWPRFAVLLVMRDRPADVGLRPFGDEAPSRRRHRRDHAHHGGPSARCATPRSERVLGSVRHLLHLRRQHQRPDPDAFDPAVRRFRHSAGAAASVLAAMGIFDFVGTIVSGWLSDRYDNRWLLFWYYGLRGLSLLFLPFTDFSFYGLSLFAMFYGLDWIATVPPTVRLTAQRFGPERANLVFGWIFAGHQLGAGVAAFGAGLSRTVLQTYLPAFFVAGALCIVAALIVLTISRPKPAAA